MVDRKFDKASYTVPALCHNVIAGTIYADGNRIPVIDPATEEQISEITEADAKLVDLAVTEARRVFDSGIWSNSSTEERQKVLTRIADIVSENADELAWLETRNIGTPITQSLNRHVPRAIHNFRYFADYISQSKGENFDRKNGFLTLVTREPVGVAALIGPWNAPIALTSMKIAAAIAFGNSCVVKPSEVSPLTAHRLIELLHEAGLPEGVVNLVNGHGAVTGAALASHPDIDVLSFTGGTVTGKAIMSAAGANLTPVTLELGGKSANIIFADADFERALDAALIGIYSNNGQQCLAGSRILVQKPIAEKFMAAFVERTKRLKIGDPLELDTELGPLATKTHFTRVAGFKDIALNEGCNLLTGGNAQPETTVGYYFQPTAVLAPDNQGRVSQEEIFGPFAAFQVFETEEEAWKLANDSQFGLLSYVWTTNLKTTMSAQKSIRSGTVCINTPIVRELSAPFGGFKESGVGRESGPACEQFYTQEKVTVIPNTDLPLSKLGNA